MTKNQIINCNIFSDKEIEQLKQASMARIQEMIQDLAILMHEPIANSIYIIYCENQIQSGKDFISNMDEILNYRHEQNNKD